LGKAPKAYAIAHHATGGDRCQGEASAQGQQRQAADYHCNSRHRHPGLAEAEVVGVVVLLGNSHRLVLVASVRQ